MIMIMTFPVRLQGEGYEVTVCRAVTCGTFGRNVTRASPRPEGTGLGLGAKLGLVVLATCGGTELACRGVSQTTHQGRA